MTATDNKTAEVLYSMFVENTGADMLDSGGYYGRNWQRNQGKSLQDFMAQPSAIVKAQTWTAVYDGKEHYKLDVTIPAFRYLEYMLDYDEAMQALYETEMSESDDYHLNDMIAFAENHADGNEVQIEYTYNLDNLFSQNFQFVKWDDDDGVTHVLLQIHGGCDARGGFTAPKAFTLPSDSRFPYCDADIYCSDCNGGWDLMDGYPMDSRFEKLADFVFVNMTPELAAEFASRDRKEPMRDGDGHLVVPVTRAESGNDTLHCPYCGNELSIGPMEF